LSQNSYGNSPCPRAWSRCRASSAPSSWMRSTPAYHRRCASLTTLIPSSMSNRSAGPLSNGRRCTASNRHQSVVRRRAPRRRYGAPWLLTHIERPVTSASSSTVSPSVGLPSGATKRLESVQRSGDAISLPRHVMSASITFSAAPSFRTSWWTLSVNESLDSPGCRSSRRSPSRSLPVSRYPWHVQMRYAFVHLPSGAKLLGVCGKRVRPPICCTSSGVRGAPTMVRDCVGAMRSSCLSENHVATAAQHRRAVFPHRGKFVRRRGYSSYLNSTNSWWSSPFLTRHWR